MAVAELLAPSGRAYFTVRRDIKRAGFRSHTEHDGVKVYQCNVVLPIAACWRWSTARSTSINTTTSSPMRTPRVPLLPSHRGTGTVVGVGVGLCAAGWRGGRAVALIVPKAHIAGYFDLPEKLRTACWLMVDRVHWLLGQRGAAEAWRIEVAVGRRWRMRISRFPRLGRGTKRNAKAQRCRGAKGYTMLFVALWPWCEAPACGAGKTPVAH